MALVSAITNTICLLSLSIVSRTSLSCLICLSLVVSSRLCGNISINSSLRRAFFSTFSFNILIRSEIILALSISDSFSCFGCLFWLLNALSELFLNFFSEIWDFLLLNRQMYKQNLIVLNLVLLPWSYLEELLIVVFR